MRPHVYLLVQSIPFVFDSGAVRSESSNIVNRYQTGTPLPDKTDYSMAVAGNSLSVTLQFTTSTAFFLNSYSMLKGALESLILAQSVKEFPASMKFCTYVGVGEYVEFGQIDSVAFSHDPNANNTFNVNVSMQRLPIKTSTPKTQSAFDKQTTIVVKKGK